MSACAIVIARDEADVIGPVVRHALAQFDEVLAVDHRSTDGTREILEALPVTLSTLGGRGLHGDREWTRLALEALGRGHEWAVVNDADEAWHVTGDPGLRIGDYLASLKPADLVVGASSFNHVPTGLDDKRERNPLLRLGWRRVGADSVKVACRLSLGVTYALHNAWYGGRISLPTVTRGLTVRHFTIRTADQLVRKVRNGMDAASVQAGLPVGYDESWEQWVGLSDAEIRAQFRSRFFVEDPATDETLVYDPAPVMDWPEPR